MSEIFLFTGTSRPSLGRTRERGLLPKEWRGQKARPTAHPPPAAAVKNVWSFASTLPQALIRSACDFGHFQHDYMMKRLETVPTVNRA
jgi:hypothetical protein